MLVLTPRPHRHRLVALALALVAVSSTIVIAADAQELEGGVARAGEPSWGDYASPARRRARQLRRQGLVKLLDARQVETVGSDLAPPVDVLYDQALVRFERARRALPEDADLVFFTALALASWHRDVDGREERRTEEAIAAFDELRRLDPDYHADRVAFELALLHTRRGDYRAAIAEYRRTIAAAMLDPAPTPYPLTDRERELATLFAPVSRATAYLNLGENEMLLGELASSVASYRRASELASGDALLRTMALWGLAVALDRSGDHREALATARRAIETDPYAVPQPTDLRLGIDRRAHGPTAVLHSRLALIEPAYELHAYDGVGWEALAQSAEAGAARIDLLRRARLAWSAFLTGGGNESTYAQHARRAAARLDEELGGAPTAPRRAR